MSRMHLDSTTQLLREMEEKETELGYLPYRWQHHWDRLEAPPANPPPPPPSHNHTVRPVQSQVPLPNLYARQYGRSVHKRSTIELLLKGKMGASSGAGEGGGAAYTHPHRFEKFNYTTPTYCDNCNSLLWGIVKTGYRCQVILRSFNLIIVVQFNSNSDF